MAGCVLDYLLVILFAHQCKQIKYTESELKVQGLRYLFGINYHYNNKNTMDAIIQVKFWIDYCIMNAKYNGIILSFYVIILINTANIKSMECIIIIYLLNNAFMYAFNKL